MTDSRLVESWTWFAFASLVVVLRYISRWIRLGGVRFFEIEDYLMIPAFGFYTNLIVFVNIQEKHPHTNILPPTGTAGMSDAEIEDRIYGAKVTFTVEESMVVLQFLCKLCMCFMYLKLTAGLKKQIWVKVLVGYIVFAFVITEVFFFGVWCRPFLNYFRVFDGVSPGCSTSQDHLKMSFAFNLSGDVFILAVPVPLLLQSHLPLKRKLIVTGVFSFGIFVIISAILSRYYCFAEPESILWIFWYVREASTAIIVANIPHLYALIRQLFHLEAFGSLVKRAAKRTGYQQYPLDSHDSNLRSHGRSTFRVSKNRSESTENFGPDKNSSLQIWQRSEFNIKTNTTSQWDDNEAQAIRLGSVGTKSTVVSIVNRPNKDTDED